MKALTLWQPWASLIAFGAKQIETRSWDTRYRGPLAIHAGKGFPLECRALCAEEPFRSALQAAEIPDWQALPLGAVVAVVTVADCRPTGRTLSSYPFAPEWLPEEGSPERAFGDYRPGRYGWFLENILRLPEPVPAKGRQGLWNWEPSAEVRALLGDTLL